jgi:hypothetical protein
MGAGHYFIRSMTKLVTLGVDQLNNGTMSYLLIGRASACPDAGGLLLAQSFDANSGVQSQVSADIAKVGGTAIRLGQKTMAASLPVVLPSDQLGQKAMTSSLPVVIASDQAAIPVTGSFSSSSPDNITIGTGTLYGARAVVKGTNTSSGTAASIIASMPASVASGDFLVMFVVQAFGVSPTFTTPAGWTLYNSYSPASSSLRVSIYTKSAAGTEGGTSVTVASTQANDYATTTYVFNGACSIEAVATTSANTVTTIQCPSVAPLTALGRLAVSALFYGGTATGASPIGLISGQTMTVSAAAGSSDCAVIRTGYEETNGFPTASGRTATGFISSVNTLGISLVIATPEWRTTSSWLTTGYGSVSLSLSGQWSGSVQVLGRDDATLPWVAQPVRETSTSYISDSIMGAGHYFIRSMTKLVTLGVDQLNGTMSYLLIGRAGAGPDAGSLLLAQSFDANSGVQSQVNIAGGLNRDPNNALILSDSKTIPVTLSAGMFYVIDTTGYQSIEISTGSQILNIAASNDGISFAGNINIWNLSTPGLTTNGQIAATQQGLTPVVSKFIRLSSPATASHTIVLRNVPFVPAAGSNAPINIAQIGGTAAGSTGIAGVLAVGGASGSGSTTGINPVLMGGIDGTSVASGIVRRILTDSSGRTITNINAGNLTSPQNNQGVQALAVQDLATFEGMDVPQLLGMILLEMKMNNLYLYELGNKIQTPYGYSSGDEPSNLRNNPSDLDG